LVGNLTRDVELRHTSSGSAVTDIAIAVNDRRKDGSGDYVDETTFVDVTLWGRTAEVAAEFLGKGRAALIHGRLKQDRWEDKEGNRRSKLKVVGDRLVLLSSGQGAEQGRNGSSYSAPAETEGIEF
jgi:single-strand DNA-binding protein